MTTFCEQHTVEIGRGVTVKRMAGGLTAEQNENLWAAYQYGTDCPPLACFNDTFGVFVNDTCVGEYETEVEAIMTAEAVYEYGRGR